jgi:NAD(P)-dependent dehydrogenase (short-subunit alcohol dehydrogenase family)
MREHFEGKGCVVTGAASGIGLALAEALLQAGAVVFMADRNSSQLTAVVGQLGAHAGRVHQTTVDVTDQAQVLRLIEDAATHHGRLDFLFNNAGIGGTMPIANATLDHWRRIVDINLWGVIYGVHAALPIMRRQGSGHIVTTASIAGLVPVPYQALYCATKYAVVGLSESLRFELGDEGINFSVVCPGNVATPIFGPMPPPEDAIPAAEAAYLILQGVAENQGIIALPEKTRDFWRAYWSQPEEVEKQVLWEMARQRRRAYSLKGTYY